MRQHHHRRNAHHQLEVQRHEPPPQIGRQRVRQPGLGIVAMAGRWVAHEAAKGKGGAGRISNLQFEIRICRLSIILPAMRRTPFIAGIVALLLMCCVAAAQEDVKITFKVKVPAGTAADAKLYLAGDAKALGEWKADGLEMKKGEDGIYSVVASLPKDKQIEYKVTRGSWETVEKNADGS